MSYVKGQELQWHQNSQLQYWELEENGTRPQILVDNDFLPRILQDKLSIKYEYRFLTFSDILDFKNFPPMDVFLESYWSSATTKMTEETKKEKDIESRQQGLEYINSLWELIHRILVKKMPGWEPLGMRRELDQKYGGGSEEGFNATNIY